MDNLSFDGVPKSLALLHDKADNILSILTAIAKDKSDVNRHVPIGMTEASRLLGKSPSTIYDMTSKRKIPFHKRGNKLYFFEDELLQWIKNEDLPQPLQKEGSPNSHTGSGLSPLPLEGTGETWPEQHLKQLQSDIKHKPGSLLTGRETVHNH